MKINGLWGKTEGRGMDKNRIRSRDIYKKEYGKEDFRAFHFIYAD